MNDDRCRQLWAQYLDVGLDPNEQEQLWRALESNQVLRAEFLDDYELDSQLHALPHMAATHTTFVSEVMGHLPSLETQRACLSSTTEPNVAYDPARAPTNFDAQNVERRTSEKESRQLARAPYVWFATGAAVASMAAMLIWAATLAFQSFGSPETKPELVKDVPPSSEPNEYSDDQSSIQPKRKTTVDVVIEQPTQPIPNKHVVPTNPETVVQGLPTPPKPVVPKPIVPIRRKSLPKVDAPVAPELMPQGDVVATLLKTDDAVWEEAPEYLVAERVWTLFSGAATFRMSDGTEVTVFGPATFELDSGYLMQLKIGRLTAHVPAKAKGFTVLTPSSTIVDLGTAFETTVHDNGATGVQVTEGRVHMETRPQEGSKKSKWILKKGDSQWVTLPGADFDWRLTIQLNERGGSIKGNGTTMVFTGNGLGAMDVVRGQFRELNAALPPTGNATEYHALLELNDRSLVIKSRREATLVEADLLRQLLQLTSGQLRREFEFNMNQMQEQLRRLRGRN